MHPAYSVIFFTTASGAGYGLLLLLGLGVPLGLLPRERGLRLCGARRSRSLLTAGGLASSTLHLGRPERAWRAFSQWRSSWLSREGVASVVTYLPAAAVRHRLGVLRRDRRADRAVRVLAAALAAATVCCTGMIYASLKPIRQWHNRWVVPNYLAARADGRAASFSTFSSGCGRRARAGLTLLALIVVLGAWWAKEGYWRSIDTTSAPSTVASATRLGSRGKVRMLEPPHTEENYLLKEMGFRIARKHRGAPALGSPGSPALRCRRC